MNAQGRKRAAALLEKLQSLRSEVESVGQEIAELASEEQDKLDNMPEGLQGSDRYQAMEEAQQQLSEAADYCDNGALGDAIDALELLS